eukprot:TRINITY_DN51587_c0_g1_i1.p1 TRINITY_DN51587_c0_g1~~TRINITY_DN51587_c0_g1_i1.p1  ORF type:complete len:524 (+),score=75.14 TRINITY_DN51587_c0_g1_i1:112-1683(+)
MDEKCSKTVVVDDEDDRSTVAPSDSFGIGTATCSTVASWDTANLDDLGNCGVLSSAEIRAARLQKIHGIDAVCSGKRPSTPGVGGQVCAAGVARSAKSASLPNCVVPGLPGKAKSSAVTVAVPKPGCSRRPEASAGARRRVNVPVTSRRVITKNATVSAPLSSDHAPTSAPSASSSFAVAKTTSCARKASASVASLSSFRSDDQEPVMRSLQVACEPALQKEGLDAISEQAIADLGLRQIMPANNPIVTQTDMGASWTVASGACAHSRPILPDRSSVKCASRGDEMKRQLDVISHEKVKDMSMPIPTQVITETAMGSSWVIASRDAERSLSQEADSVLVGRGQTADDLRLQLDANSRDQIKALGLAESMPAKNPVVTRETDMGATWHVPFGKSEGTSVGISEPLQRPHDVEELRRHLDVISREKIKLMGISESMPARNPVVTRETDMGASWNVAFSDSRHAQTGGAPLEHEQTQRIAEDLQRQLDKHSREEIRSMGLWEYMPARNPVVTKQTDMGSSWHISFA